MGKIASPRHMDYYTNKGKAHNEIASKLDKIDKTYKSPRHPASPKAPWDSVLSKAPGPNAKSSTAFSPQRKLESSSGRTINPDHSFYRKQEAAHPPKAMRRPVAKATKTMQKQENKSAVGKKRPTENKVKT